MIGFGDEVGSEGEGGGQAEDGGHCVEEEEPEEGGAAVDEGEEEECKEKTLPECTKDPPARLKRKRRKRDRSQDEDLDSEKKPIVMFRLHNFIYFRDKNVF